MTAKKILQQNYKTKLSYPPLNLIRVIDVAFFQWDMKE